MCRATLFWALESMTLRKIASAVASRTLTKVSSLRYQQHVPLLPSARHPKEPDAPHLHHGRPISRRHHPDLVGLSQCVQQEGAILIGVRTKERWIASGIVFDPGPGDTGARGRITHRPAHLPGRG